MMRLCIRRSTALCQQGHYQSSIQDLKAALEFSPGDSTIISDIGKILGPNLKKCKPNISISIIKQKRESVHLVTNMSIFGFFEY